LKPKPQRRAARSRGDLLAGALMAICWCALAGPAGAEPPGRGKLLFLRCASCHDISPAASPKIGPNLYGVVGRKAGGLPGYDYSAAMKTQDFLWDDAHLDRWLTNPSDLVPGTAMAFGGVSSEADRAAIIAYLRKAAK
jgi:cytochrome c